MGSVLSIPISGEDTRGRFALVEYKGKPGNEPPPHLHEWEDEFYHVLEGRAEFHCDEQRFVAEAGDYVFIPQGSPHTFDILTPSIRLVVMVCSLDERPVGLDRYFLKMGEPATSLDLPVAGTATTYATTVDHAHAVRLATEHGTRFLSPDEVRELLPNYPGFCAAKR